ncbi:DNA-directed RNA polymerase specialized sigma24 family protein [Saonia flava]|uniref:DNA-directed RNA polymerase specialized sigma24 family protein n=1 Tax=Saonia flava TaxID=523696 RepID=A0A846R4C2_9FLAO|nr:sigma factor [Saonia flava]NJB72214.1 DNA-directed RNA polymerase specialized sigma24 family protein [Saonia flava]
MKSQNPYIGPVISPNEISENSICRKKFVALYEQYWESLYAIGYSRIKSKNDVEDIIQEIFINLWNRKTFKVNGCMKVYLHTAMKY